MSIEVTLPVGASAEADTCGSCRFYRRLSDNGPSYWTEGYCNIKLPPTVLRQFQPKPYNDGDEDRLRMKDRDRCDLQRPDGKSYIVQRRVGAAGC